MRFKDFLYEAKHRQDISLEKAAELFKANCGQCDPDHPLWRGSKNAAEPAYLMHGEAGGRVSAATSNHYTVIMDHFLPGLGFPERGKSLISSTDRSYAAMYVKALGDKNSKGDYFALFPFDGVKIGVCGGGDIWHLKVRLKDKAYDIERLNNVWEEMGIPDYSFEDLVQGLKDGLEDFDDEDNNDILAAQFGSASAVEDVLKKAYTPPTFPVKLITSKDIKSVGDCETWVAGKCVAVRAADLEAFKKLL